MITILFIIRHSKCTIDLIKRQASESSAINKINIETIKRDKSPINEKYAQKK